MSAVFELVALDCPTCGSSVEAEGADVVYYCVSCRNGYRFDREVKGLAPLDVVFVAAPHVEAGKYLPFWQLPATVELRERTGSRAGLAGLAGLMSSFFGGGSSGSASGRGVFVVPAFQAPLAVTTELTRRYTEEPPSSSLGEKLGERLVGGRYGVGDARKLAHFALIATEIDKPDVLKRLDYRLEFGQARLLAVPFARDDEGWRDALYGIRL